VVCAYVVVKVHCKIKDSIIQQINDVFALNHKKTKLNLKSNLRDKSSPPPGKYKNALRKSTNAVKL